MSLQKTGDGDQVEINICLMEQIEDPIRSELLSLLAFVVLKYFHYQRLNRLLLRFSPDDHGPGALHLVDLASSGDFWFEPMKRSEIPFVAAVQARLACITRQRKAEASERDNDSGVPTILYIEVGLCFYCIK